MSKKKVFVASLSFVFSTERQGNVRPTLTNIRSVIIPGSSAEKNNACRKPFKE